jgi:hypothetical protein
MNRAFEIRRQFLPDKLIFFGKPAEFRLSSIGGKFNERINPR